MSSARPITTAQAQVTTATVEIRTLTVSGKRMSIAVYEQMPHRNHLWVEADGPRDWRLEVAPGEVWGWVNRHDPACTGAPHRHLVAVHEGTLYRSTLHARPWEQTHAIACVAWPFYQETARDQWGGWMGYYWAVTRPGGRAEEVETITIETMQQEWADEYGLAAVTPQLYIAT